MSPLAFNPDQVAPYPDVALLREKHEKIIHSALLGGHNYDDALAFADKHVTPADFEAARLRDKARMEAWEIRRAKANEPSWIDRYLSGMYKG